MITISEIIPDLNEEASRDVYEIQQICKVFGKLNVKARGQSLSRMGNATFLLV
jgi:hypothetical protein